MESNEPEVMESNEPEAVESNEPEAMESNEPEAVESNEPEVMAENQKSGDKLNVVMGLVVLLVLALTAVTIVYSSTQLKDTERAAGKGAYNVYDYITLGSYMGMVLDKSEVEVTDESVQEQVDQLLASNSTINEVTEGTVKVGNTVNIDYVGTLDGEAFDGGSDEGYDLTIGTNTFIDGFESGLIGKEVGEKVKLNLTFPDPYERNPDMAGKDVVFTVTINSIQESVKPEYTDEFVQSVTEYDTIEAYETSIRESQEKTKLENAIYQKLMDEAEVSSYPESLIEYYYNYVKEVNASSMGQSFEDLLAAYDMTEESFREMVISSVETTAKQDMIFEVISKEQGIEMDEKGFKDYVGEMVSAYGMTADDYLETVTDDQKVYMEDSYVWEKTMSMLTEHVVVE